MSPCRLPQRSQRVHEGLRRSDGRYLACTIRPYATTAVNEHSTSLDMSFQVPIYPYAVRYLHKHIFADNVAIVVVANANLRSAGIATDSM